MMNKNPMLTLARRGQSGRGPKLPMALALSFLLALAVLLTNPFPGTGGFSLPTARAEEMADPIADPMADPIVEEVVARLRQQTGQEPESQAIVDKLNLLTVGFYHKGKHSLALRSARLARTLAEETLGEEHPDTLISLNILASLYDAKGQHGEAEALYEKVLAVRKRVLGKNHPDTRASLENLLKLYQAQDRYSEAYLLLQETMLTEKPALDTEQ